jgi:predicted HTH transcriptional regulator
MSMTQNVITLRNGYSDLNGAGASNVTNFESVNFIPEESIVLSMFADKVAIKNSQVAEALGVSSSKARNVLRALVDKGVLKAVGQNKSRVYLLAQ